LTSQEFNEALRLPLEEVRVQLMEQTRILERMEQKLERRTALYSPAKGYSNDAYARSGEAFPSDIDRFRLISCQPKFQTLKYFPSHKLMIIHSLFTLMGKFRTPQ
jgi:hypothetical protein